MTTAERRLIRDMIRQQDDLARDAFTVATQEWHYAKRDILLILNGKLAALPRPGDPAVESGRNGDVHG